LNLIIKKRPLLLLTYFSSILVQYGSISIPINFSSWLVHGTIDKDNLIAIDKWFDKLLTALRANEYKLDKEATSYHDILDAFRLSLQLYQRSNR
jgi:hypothetical protein